MPATQIKIYRPFFQSIVLLPMKIKNSLEEKNTVPLRGSMTLSLVNMLEPCQSITQLSKYSDHETPTPDAKPETNDSKLKFGQ
jgi:hypothetical protein